MHPTTTSFPLFHLRVLFDPTLGRPPGTSPLMSKPKSENILTWFHPTYYYTEQIDGKASEPYDVTRL